MNRRYLLRWAPVALFGLALVVFLVLFVRFQRKPEILSLDRLMAGPGERIEITGRWFGDGEDGSRLLVGSNTLTSGSILEWDDHHIVARVPRSDGAVLVKVKTRSGTSRGVILGDARRFPKVNYGAWLPGAPYIEYADPADGIPGSLMTFHGSGFGDRRGSGEIWVNRNDETSILGMEAPDLDLYVRVREIESWTDRSVSFRVPEGVRGGNAYLFKGGYFSNPVSLEIGNVPGLVWQGDRQRFSLRQEVEISRIGSFPGNTLYLCIPSPASGLGQGEAVVLDSPFEEGTARIGRNGDLGIYRLKELTPGKRSLVGRQLVVTTRPLRFQVEPSELVPYDPEHSLLAENLGRDDWINPDSVSQVAAGAQGGSRDDWSKGRALYNYVLARLDWVQEPETRVAAELIRSRQADSMGYAFLYTSLARAVDIPARPVGGIIIDSEGTSRRWWWAEIWIQGLGWAPVDAALGDSADGIRLPGGPDEQEAADFYFGGLEGRHIAFSRGIEPAEQLQPSSELRIPQEFYTLQENWEELSGNLTSYQSSWPVPRLTAVYDVR